MFRFEERITGPRVFAWLEDFPPVRESGRVLLVSDAGRAVLSMGCNFPGGPTYLLVPGGGLKEGESPLDAAVREIDEETGYRFEPSALVGPVAVREATLDFTSVRGGACWLSREFYFAARLSDALSCGGAHPDDDEVAFGGGQTALYSREEVASYAQTHNAVAPGYHPVRLFDIWDAAEDALCPAG